jgi:hypothetical protein
MDFGLPERRIISRENKARGQGMWFGPLCRTACSRENQLRGAKKRLLFIGTCVHQVVCANELHGTFSVDPLL